MAMARCPQCGRVADGTSCFACGYEWPRSELPTLPHAKPATKAAPPPPPAPTPAPAMSPIAPGTTTAQLDALLNAPSPFASPAAATVPHSNQQPQTQLHPLAKLEPSSGRARAGENLGLASFFDDASSTVVTDSALPRPKTNAFGLSDSAMDAGDFFATSPPVAAGSTVVDGGPSFADVLDAPIDTLEGFGFAGAGAADTAFDRALHERGASGGRLVNELKAFAERLRDSGAQDDADLVMEAIMALDAARGP